MARRQASTSFNLVRAEYADNSMNKGLATGAINEDDIALIREFIAELQATAGIGTPRINKLVFHLVGWRRFIGPYRTNTITDLYQAIPKIKTAPNARGRAFKQNTIVDYIKILKQFYTWMVERGYSGIPKDRLSKLRAPPRDEMTKQASDLLTYDEVLAMARACWREMDRALIMTLYEGGFRIGEIGKMTWGNLNFDDQGVVVNTDFKTGKPRYIRLILAANHIAKWRGCYPGKPEGNAPVFITVNGPLTHGAVVKQLRRVADRAGIKRHITPHIFRHSRITHMIQKGISESVIKKMMWGTIDSRMFRTYVHLTGKDIDQELQRVYGLAPNNTESAMKKAMEPRVCPACQTINSPVTNYCGTCGHELSEQAVRDLESALRRIQQNPDFKFIREMAEKSG